ncbi:MAG: site-specific integrase [Chloroflexi bacterium]|nr:site-specific integrase [Chloroflexota bacterium]
MNGSIRKKNTKSWEITIDLGRDDNGKRRRKYEYVTGTKAEAQRRLRELLTDLDKGLPIDAPKMTLGAFLDTWLIDYAEIRTVPRTVDGYRGTVERYLKPNLGNILLSKLTQHHVQRLYSDMRENGLSARTILHTHKLLSQALKHAVKWGLLIRNICEAVDPPRPRRKEMKALDTDDVQVFLEAIKDSPYGHLFFVMLYTGLRRGEVLGVRWCDVDINKETLSVNQSVVRLHNKGLMITEPKTPYSRRLISLSPSVVALLRGLRVSQMDQMEGDGIEWEEQRLIFANDDGEPLSPDTVTHAFAKIIKRTGLPHVRLHDLRHTHATLMLKQGVHPKIVSERLGHSSVSITMDTYSHVLPGMQTEAAIAFEEAIHVITAAIGPV